MSGDKLFENTINIGNKKYSCAKHGETEYYIESTIKEYEGKYCSKCWMEAIVKTCCKLTDLSDK